MTVDRLAEDGVDVEAISSQFLEHCPPATLTANYGEPLLHTPLRVSDYMLSRSLGLQLANNENQPEKSVQQTVLYV